MSNPTVDAFAEKKAAESNFVSLADGESVKVVELKEIKAVTKAGFTGEETDVLRFKCAVNTSEGVKEKDFDNGTQRFAKELQEKGITVGSAFVITRNGEGPKTRYTISEVVNPGAQVAPAPAPAPAQVAPAPAQVAPVEGAPVAP